MDIYIYLKEKLINFSYSLVILSEMINRLGTKINVFLISNKTLLYEDIKKKLEHENGFWIRMNPMN